MSYSGLGAGKAYTPKAYLPKAYLPKAYLPKAYSPGPTNAFPVFRQHGFHSFQGLGAIDRPSTENSARYVFSITAVRGLPSGAAPSVPSEIVRKLSRYFVAAQAGWAAGGRVWGAFQPPRGAGISAMTDEQRRSKLKAALDSAASAIGRDVSFEVAGYGAIPASSSAPAASTPVGSEGSTVVALPPIPIQGGGVVKSTRDLQSLLRSKGFNPGSVDGRWGPRTAGALNAAAAAARVSADGTVGSADGRSVSLNSSVWDAISDLPNRSTSVVAAPAAAPVSSEPLPGEGSSFPVWVPVAGGAAVLLGVGVYFMRKKKRG